MNWFRETPSLCENSSAFFRTDGISLSGNLLTIFFRFVCMICFLSSECNKKVLWSQYSDSEAACDSEILQVVRYHNVSITINGNIQDHVIVAVVREWPVLDHHTNRNRYRFERI